MWVRELIRGSTLFIKYYLPYVIRVKSCVFMFIPNGDWNHTLWCREAEQIHVRPNSPPGLGRTQGVRVLG